MWHLLWMWTCCPLYNKETVPDLPLCLSTGHRWPRGSHFPSINSYFMLLHSSISVQIEQNAIKFKIAPRKHESIFNFFFANNQRPLIIWFLCFTENPEIYYQDFFPTWKKKCKGVVIPFLIEMWNLNTL
jgi:hypothetical protein